MEYGKKSILLIGLVLMLAMSFCPLVAQEDTDPEESKDWILSEGKAETKEGAVAKARCAALLKYVKKNMPAEDFNSFESDIENFISSNWQEYCEGADVSPVFVKQYEGRTVRIMVKVKGDQLLEDIAQKFLRAGKKAEGMEAALFLEKGKKAHKNSDVMLDTIQDEIGKSFKILSAKDAEARDKVEAKSLGISAQDDPEGYLWRKFDLVRIYMFFWLKTQKDEDDQYTVTIGARGVHRWSGQELFKFQVQNSGGLDRVQAIKTTARKVAAQIIEKVAFYRNVLPEQVYTVKFVNFGKLQDRERIQQAMLDLEKQEYLKILPGGGAAGPLYFHYRIKWMKKHSQWGITSVIQEFCLSNQVKAKCFKFTPGIMIFEPPDSNWVEAGTTVTEPKPEADDEEEEVVEEEEEDKDWIEVKGKGTTKEGAIANGCRKAIMMYLKENMDEADYNLFLEKIEAMVFENWKDYIVGEPKIVKRHSEETRFITIKVKVNEQVLADVEHKFLKAGKKLEGMGIVVSHEVEPAKQSKDELLDHDAAFDTLQDSFQNYGGKFYSDAALKEMLKVEAQSLGISAQADPGAYIQKYADRFNIRLFIWVTSVGQKQPDSNDYAWEITMGVRGLWVQTGEEIFKFQVRSGERLGEEKIAPAPVRTVEILTNREARVRGIKELAKFMGDEIAERVANRKGVIPTDEYIFKFVGFTAKQKEKVESAMQDLEAGTRPFLKIKSSSGAGTEYFTMTVKWLRTKQSQAKVVQIVKEQCEENMIKVKVDKQSKGNIIFQPGN